jgi:hypothetical protein
MFVCRSGVVAREWLAAVKPLDPTERTSASLTQGRLLLGMVDGKMTVWGVHR